MPRGSSTCALAPPGRACDQSSAIPSYNAASGISTGTQLRPEGVARLLVERHGLIQDFVGDDEARVLVLS